MNQELISVIIPIYNMEKYLVRCLESILLQTYKNLEIILINDGSTDKSEQICKEYCIKDIRFHLFSKKNGGSSSARNYGIEKSRGNIIGFIDPDDWIEPDFFLKLYNNMKLSNAQIAICGYKLVNHEEKIIKTISYNWHIYLNKSQALNDLCSEKIQNYSCNKIFEKRLFNNIYFPEGKIYEDLAIMHLLFLNAESIVTIEDSLYNYFIHSNSQVHDQSKFIDAFEMFYQRYLYLQKVELRDIDISRKKTLQRTAEYAFKIIYIQPELYVQINKQRLNKVKYFWKKNKKEICKLNLSCFIRVYFPHIFVFLKKNKDKIFKFIK